MEEKEKVNVGEEADGGKAIKGIEKKPEGGTKGVKAVEGKKKISRGKARKGRVGEAKKPTEEKGKKKLNIPKLLFIIGVSIGAIIVGFPFVARYVNGIKNEKVLDNYEEYIHTISDEDILTVRVLLNKYNEDSRENQEEDVKEIVEKLDDKMLGTIEIGAVGIKVPIYLDLTTKKLSEGAVHLNDSNLPNDRESSNCVLIGHSGLSYQAIFDNLHDIKGGEEVRINIFGDEYVYKVREVKICTPDELSLYTGMVQGKNILTLITCTPIGVNSHRLVVISDFERIESK